MKAKAVYPGSFDPVTNGHIDIIKRSLKIFDSINVAVVRNPDKKTLFSIEERVNMLKKVFNGFKNVTVDSFDGLLVDYVRINKCKVIIRGLRAISDFEYEFQMALMNRKLASDIEMVYMMPNEIYTYLSSSIIKEVVGFGGSAKGFVPSFIEKKLKEKLCSLR